ncbi:hypothetical protein E0K83_10755 [Gramella sp. BOM4]|nr:hypothetical protein [Christiangramia bathymodioli]
METAVDWSRFEIKMPLDFDEIQIREHWLTQENLEKWFLRKAGFLDKHGKPREKNAKIQPGDSYKWQWHGWPESVEEQGVVLEPHKGEFLRFSFGKAGIVGLSMLQEQEESILKLVQEHIPLDEESRMNFHVGCKTGWTFYMLNLKSILLNGPDLRNKNLALQMD